MYFKTDLFFPSIDKTLKIQVYLPNDSQDGNEPYDTIYIFDGQNAFKNKEASFGRSLHFSKYLSQFRKIHGKNICAVAIDSPIEEDLRTNIYSPFAISKKYSKILAKPQDFSKCADFTDDYINVLIPYIEANYTKSGGKKFLFGASLGATYADYVAHQYPNLINGVGLFSNPLFLFQKEYLSFSKKNCCPNLKIFLYVGTNENSDKIFTPYLYMNSALALANSYKKTNEYFTFVVNDNGKHSEASWEQFIYKFVLFMYYIK